MRSPAIQILRASLVPLFLLPVACGKSGGGQKSADDSPITTEEFTTVSAGVADAGSALQLASVASAFSFVINGCASGFTGSITESQSSIKLYKTDSGCLGKLISFAVAGTSYTATNPNAVAFSSFAVGQSATYTDATGLNKMQVTVTAQLPATLSGTENVSYTFSMIAQGVAQTVQKNDLGDAHSFTVGGDVPPNFGIDSISFHGVNGAGAGKFTFKLQCLAAQTGSGASTACSALNLTDISYLLVDDTFNGVPSIANLNAMTGFTAISTGDFASSTSNSFGGFTTIQLIGPATITARPNMILVLKNGASYEYFTINVETL